MPNLSSEASEELSKEIIIGVAQYDQTLNNLNKAIESGLSKEEWLADRMADAYSDMTLNDVGGKLLQIESELTKNNALLMGKIESTQGHIITVGSVEIVDWNEYSIKSKVLDIGKQTFMSGLGVFANTIKLNIESGEGINSDIIGKALQNGLETSSAGVKAVVAGAIKSAVENKLTDVLNDTPVETICDIAGMAVESADALLGVATGKTTVVEALDKTSSCGLSLGG